jgi:MFS family permease
MTATWSDPGAAMKIAHFALLFVVVIDLMGQGLVLPLVTTLILDADQGIMPAGTSHAVREFDYGLAIGLFFFSWFLGAAYISKLSDSVGRKTGIMICLAGGFVGYALTIVAIYLDSYVLLVIGRVISGFTAGNQPIAQAALVDMSRSEEEKTRFMSLIVVALSGGLVGGPLIGGVLSDPDILGDLASLVLPFYAAAGLVLLNAVLIVVFFHETLAEKKPFVFKPAEAFLVLYQAALRPLVMRVALVFFFSQLAFNAAYVFLSDYYTERFDFGTFENSMEMIVLGACLGLSSLFLVPPIAARFRRKRIIVVTLALMCIGGVCFIVNGSAWLTFVPVVVLIVPFAVNYPTMLTLFSNGAGKDEQGWVMGVTVALFTLGAGMVSLFGGWLMSLNVHMPFFISVASGLIALALVVALWRRDMMETLDPQ